MLTNDAGWLRGSYPQAPSEPVSPSESPPPRGMKGSGESMPSKTLLVLMRALSSSMSSSSDWSPSDRACARLVEGRPWDWCRGWKGRAISAATACSAVRGMGRGAERIAAREPARAADGGRLGAVPYRPLPRNSAASSIIFGLGGLQACETPCGEHFAEEKQLPKGKP